MKDSENTADRILQCAERLFSTRGYKETSMRAITVAAGVNVASVNYYFGSKEGLLRAVIKRRLTPLNEKRLMVLGDIEKRAISSQVPPSVREIMRAIFEPVLDFRASIDDFDVYLRLIARTMTDPDEKIRGIFVQEMQPVFHKAFSLLVRALPGLSKDEIFWRFYFSIGAMGHALWWFKCGECVSRDGVDSSMDSGKLLELWLDYVTRGIGGDTGS